MSLEPYPSAYVAIATFVTCFSSVNVRKINQRETEKGGLIKSHDLNVVFASRSSAILFRESSVVSPSSITPSRSNMPDPPPTPCCTIL